MDVAIASACFAGRAVGFALAGHRSEPAGQLQVAGGIVGHTDAVVQKRVQFPVVQVDAVGGHHLCLKDVLLLDPRYRRHAVLGPVVLYLLRGLGDVDLDGDVVLPCQ
jgi:hypothetical protein